MKKLLLIAILLTTACKQEIIVKIDNTEVKELKAKVDSLENIIKIKDKNSKIKSGTKQTRLEKLQKLRKKYNY